jgi:diacylglycerol kinase (ATP)
VLVALLLVPLGIWLGESGAERALLVGSWLLVLMMELLNSAVEAVVDRVGEEHNELSGRAKDIASAAVLLAIGVAILIWALILLPRLIAT